MDLPPAEPGPAPEDERPEAERPAQGAPDRGPADELEAAPEAVPVAPEPVPAPSGRRLPRIVGERRRPIAVVAVVVAVILVLGAGEALLSPGASPEATPGGSGAPTGGAGTSPATTASGATAGGSAAVSPGATTPTAPAESLPAQTAPTAEITFDQLVLDTTAGRSGLPSTLTFVSDGPGLVSVSVVASSPTDSTRVCLSGDGGTPICSTGATPAATFYSRSSQSRWSATLESAGSGPPTIDVAVRWPANKPSITIAHSPFEGEPNRDSLRSVTATVGARAAGTIDVGASWAPDVLSVSLSVQEVEAGAQSQVDAASYSQAQSVSPPHQTPIQTGRTYVVTLMNLSPAGAGADLVVTFDFP